MRCSVLERPTCGTTPPVLASVIVVEATSGVTASVVLSAQGANDVIGCDKDDVNGDWGTVGKSQAEA